MGALKGRVPWNKWKVGVQVAWNKGQTLSDDHKLHMSISTKGKKKSAAGRLAIKNGHLRGELHPMWKGGKVSYKCDYCKKENLIQKHILKRKSRRFCNRKCKNLWLRIYYRGEKGPGWKGGVTLENHRIRTNIEYRLWRESVYARDNWACQKCRKKNGIKINAHHIKSFFEFPELRTSIANGITFCKQCHKRFHKLFGRTCNNEVQLDRFLDGN